MASISSLCRSINVSAVLLEAPFCLRAEVYVTLIGDTVRTIPMFKRCDEPFIRHLCSTAKYNHFCAGEFVIRSGNLDENLYIVRRGEVKNFSNWLYALAFLLRH